MVLDRNERAANRSSVSRVLISLSERETTTTRVVVVEEEGAERVDE